MKVEVVRWFTRCAYLGSWETVILMEGLREVYQPGHP